MKKPTKENTQRLIATLMNMWHQKHGDPLDLDLLKDTVANVLLEKMQDDITKQIDFMSIPQLISMCTELVDLTSVKKKTMTRVTTDHQWKRPKEQQVH